MNANPYALKGKMPCANTKFGRHYRAFDALREQMEKSGKKHYDCIVVGPGMDSAPAEFIRTYQPFELANSLMHAGIEDYQIDVMDMNPRVLEELKKRPAKILVRNSMIYEYKYDIETDADRVSEFTKYHYRFFWNDQLADSFFGDNHTKIVEIPETVTSKLKPIQGDIILDDIGKEKYDVAVCTVVLSHYYPGNINQILQMGEAPNVGSVMKKLKDSVNPGGFMISTELGTCGPDEWEEIAFHRNYAPENHETSAELVRKR